MDVDAEGHHGHLIVERRTDTLEDARASPSLRRIDTARWLSTVSPLPLKKPRLLVRRPFLRLK